MSESTEVPQEIQNQTTIISTTPVRRNLFDNIINRFRPPVESPQPSQEVQQPPQNYTKLKLNRRKFLVGAGATLASIAAGQSIISNVDAVNDVVIDKLLAGISEASAVSLSNDTKSLAAYAEQNPNESSLRYDVVQQINIGETNWSEEEYKLLADMVHSNKALIESVYGTPAAWTDKEIVIFVKDFLGDLKRDNNTTDSSTAKFYDGDMLARYVHSEQFKKALSHINMIGIPKKRLQQVINGTKDDYELRATVGHEMVHAFNQDMDDLPLWIMEGRAELIKFLYLHKNYAEKLGKSSSPSDADIQAFDIVKKTHADFALKRFQEGKPFNISDYYNASGFLFFEWYRNHPTFFKELRLKENEHFAQTQRKPTYQEWQTMGDGIVPGFSEWIRSQHVFNSTEYPE